MVLSDALKAAGDRRPSLWTAITWIVIIGYLAAVVGWAWNPTPAAEALAALGIVAAVIHAGFNYGWRQALVLFGICLGVTFAIENLGAATGFPFGHYHFEVGRTFPHVGLIPLIVGPLWFGMGYFAWVLAGILLDGADYRLSDGKNLVALPLVAAFVMTQWDLVMDAPNATIAKAWIWHDGGGDFGVPISNYFGWLLTAWLFYQLFALYLRRESAAMRRAQRQTRGFRALAILFYISSGLTQVIPWLMRTSGQVADATGHLWSVQDLRETRVEIMLFTMLFVSLLAALRLAQDRPVNTETPHSPSPAI